MSELALISGGNGNGSHLATRAAALSFSLPEVWDMATYVAESRLFPNVTTPQAAFTLMMLCQSDGIHPIQAIRRYHIIEGRPSMRSDAIQAEFQARGGNIKIVRCDAIEARAIFSHPVHQPEPYEAFVTYAEFEKSGMVRGKDGVKKNWRESTADMLWARLVTKNIRRIDPGVVVGIYSSDEVADMLDSERREPLTATVVGESLAAPRESYVDPKLHGYAGPGLDPRAYHEVVTDETRIASDHVLARGREVLGPQWEPAVAIKPPAIHGQLMLRAINVGHAEGPCPTTTKPVIEAMNKIYKAEREWVRRTLLEVLDEVVAKALAPVEAAAPAAPSIEPADEELPDEPGSRG